MKKADAIFTGDWHLQETTPLARTDNYWDEQWRKVDEVANLQTQHDCPIYHAGDLFDKWKPSPNLIRETIEHLPKQFHTIYGNHDLPQRNIAYSHQSGIAALAAAKVLTVLNGTHWKQLPKKKDAVTIKGKKILLWHTMTYKGTNLPFPGCTDANTKELLNQYKKYDVILTGHYHITLFDKKKGRLLLNAGSLTRMKADQMRHRPMVYLYYAKTNTVTPYFLPIKKGVLTREHIDIKTERDNQLDAYISNLDVEYSISTSFETNVENFLAVNKTKKGVVNIIQKALDNE